MCNVQREKRLAIPLGMQAVVKCSGVDGCCDAFCVNVQFVNSEGLGACALAANEPHGHAGGKTRNAGQQEQGAGVIQHREYEIVEGGVV